VANNNPGRHAGPNNKERSMQKILGIDDMSNQVPDSPARTLNDRMDNYKVADRVAGPEHNMADRMVRPVVAAFSQNAALQK
jgi:hypothetical protein